LRFPLLLSSGVGQREAREYDCSEKSKTYILDRCWLGDTWQDLDWSGLMTSFSDNVATRTDLVHFTTILSFLLTVRKILRAKRSCPRSLQNLYLWITT
jgi:hypothetical protein